MYTSTSLTNPEAVKRTLGMILGFLTISKKGKDKLIMFNTTSILSNYDLVVVSLSPLSQSPNYFCTLVRFCNGLLNYREDSTSKSKMSYFQLNYQLDLPIMPWWVGIQLRALSFPDKHSTTEQHPQSHWKYFLLLKCTTTEMIIGGEISMIRIILSSIFRIIRPEVCVTLVLFI